MNNQRVARSSRLSDTRSSWEDKGTSEVAAGKLEVMEKFFTPVAQSGGQRRSKCKPKEESRWDGARNQYFRESMSSSSPSSSSSPWSSESNFRVHPQFRGYSSRAPHSRSCNDLYSEKGKGSDDKRDFAVKRDVSHLKKTDREKTENYSPQRSGAGSIKKSSSGIMDDAAPNNRSVKEDKRMLQNGGRRARSMEALAEKETRKRQGKNKKKVTEEKQRFSQFLNEITIQVLSPSNLNSLGVKEMQNTSNRDQWKNSSTDSSGSRGNKSQCLSVEVQQEIRRKGKGKLGSGTRKNVGADALEPWRRREMSTSPDSISSSARQKRDRENTNRETSTTSHQPRRASRRMSQEKVGKQFEQLERDNKDVNLGASVLKGKTPYVEKAQNSNLASEGTAKVPTIPPPAWWGDSASTGASHYSDKIIENFDDQSRRITDKFSGAQSCNQNQETNLNSTIVSEQDKDCLNQKITDLLDHLVRAQSTICALEKLNVASLLNHLPADVLKSVNISHEDPDGGIQTEGMQDLKSPIAMSSQTSHPNICSGNMKQTREDNTTESLSAPRLTAFSPWSPRRQKSFPALHTLYTSTESECSLEDTPPTCRLLSPRFPNLGESFSDDRKDDQKTDGYDSRSEHTEAPKSSLPVPSLLPAHRTNQRTKHTRASSTESSGDDQLIHWTDAPSYEPSLDYHSAQNILDTLLGLKTHPDKINTPNPEITGGGFSCVNASKIDGHIIRSENKYLNNPKSIATRTDIKHVSYSVMNKDGLYTSDQRSQLDPLFCKAHSPLSSPADDSGHRLHPADCKLPPIPAKRSSFSGGFVHTGPPPSPVGEVGFRPVGKTDGSVHYKSDCLLSPCYLPTPMQPPDSISKHSDSFVHRSPSVAEPALMNWEGQEHQQEGQRERKPRKERSVTFCTMNESKQSPVTVRSKFMSNRVGDQGQEDSTSMDSTLL